MTDTDRLAALIDAARELTYSMDRLDDDTPERITAVMRAYYAIEDAGVTLDPRPEDGAACVECGGDSFAICHARPAPERVKPCEAYRDGVTCLTVACVPCRDYWQDLILRSRPAPDAALPGHQTPGEYHDYRVACAKCGEPGFLHVSWRPEKDEEGEL